MSVLRRLAALEHEIKVLRLRVTSAQGGGVPAAPHASSHSDGGSDEVDVTDLAGYPGGSPKTYLDSDGTFSTPEVDAVAGPHAMSHYDGGSDEVDITQLGGFPGGSPVTYLDSNGEFTEPDTGSSGSGVQTLISEVSPSGTGTVSFTGIPATYRDLRLVVRGRGTQAAANVNVTIQINGDTGGNYDRQRDAGNNTSQVTSAVVAQTNFIIANISAASAPSGRAGACEAMFYDYRGTTFHKAVLSMSTFATLDTAAGQFIEVWGCHWRSTAAINRIDVILSAGNFDSGSVVSLYGVM